MVNLVIMLEQHALQVMSPTSFEMSGTTIMSIADVDEDEDLTGIENSHLGQPPLPEVLKIIFFKSHVGDPRAVYRAAQRQTENVKFSIATRNTGCMT